MHVVASVDEIPPGSHKIVEVAGREIGVFNVSGRFFAVRNRCPHMAGPLCEGYVSGAVTSDGPGDYRFDREGEILRCPWHQWEFDMRTGQSWFDPEKVRVRAYQARVESGASLSNVAAGADESSPAPQTQERGAATSATHPGRVAGPYVAETYPVSVDRDYVIIDLKQPVHTSNPAMQ